jgi:hypothetical protein
MTRKDHGSVLSQEPRRKQRSPILNSQIVSLIQSCIVRQKSKEYLKILLYFTKQNFVEYGTIVESNVKAI